jgi:feruloyl esterase
MTCEDLSSLEVPHTTITSAVRETSGVIDPAIGMAGATGLPPFCRVAGTISPTADSRILFEVWMPLESWNGRFSGVGNGGWAGAISRTGGRVADWLVRSN